MEAIILTVGDEILIGQVIDTNSAWMGQTLNEVGISVKEILSVGDELEDIVNAINYCMSKADLVLMTGGLGPTKDDITKVAIAKYFEVGMKYSEETYTRIEKIFLKFGKTVNESHKDQCFMPENARLLFNKMGTAPGMLFQKDTKMLISMPGVPFEMKYILKEEFIPLISKQITSKIYHNTILTAGEGESFIADRIEYILKNLPPYIKIAYLPSLGYVRLRLSGNNENFEKLKNTINEFSEKIINELGSIVVCNKDCSLEEYLLEIFNEKKLTLSTAESCTGGYLAHRITSVSGSSSYFLGSIISYSNGIKSSLLNVKESTLKNHGAVSEATVREMLIGLLNQTQSDIGVAISGVAGPNGGSVEKPVGTIWLAYGNRNKQEVLLLNATKDRMKNIEYAANVAMNKLRLFIQII